MERLLAVAFAVLEWMIWAFLALPILLAYYAWYALFHYRALCRRLRGEVCLLLAAFAPQGLAAPELSGNSCSPRNSGLSARAWLRVALAALLVVPQLSMPALANDVEVELNSSNGSTDMRVLDSGGAVVGRIDSDGNMLMIGTGTIQNGLVVTGGNLGIGTGAPAVRLHTHGPAGFIGPLLLVSTSTSKLFEVNGSSIVVGLPLHFPDGSIQTTAVAVSTGFALLTSTQTFTGQNTFAGLVDVATTAVFSNGNVGIGTLSPNALFDVQGAAQFGSGNVNLIGADGRIPALSSTYLASVDGSALTGLNASNLGSGTVPSGVVSGSYSGITGVGTIGSGVWNGTPIAAAYLAPGATNYIQLRDTLQSGATFYVSSGTVQGTLTSIGGFIGNGSGLTNISATDLAAGTYSNAITMSNLSHTGGSVAANIIIGVVPGANLGSGATSYIQLRDTLQSGATFYVSSGTVQGTLTSVGGFVGSGAGLTGLNATALTAGTVPSGAISGSYTGITGVGTLASGNWNASPIGGAYLAGGATSYIQLRDTLQSGATFYVSSGTVQGTLTSIGGFIGNGSGLTNVTVSDLAAGTYSNAITMSNLSHTGGSVAANIITGIVPGGNLGGGATSYIQLRDTLQSGATFYVSSGTVQGTLTSIGGFIGSGAGLTNVTVSDLAAGTYSNAITMSNLSHTGGLVAANIITGVIPGSNLGGGATSYIQLRDTLQAGSTFYVSSGTVQGTLTSLGGFIGSGTGLTSLNATALTGTVPSGAISGNYSGITGVGSLASGNWNANPIGGAYLAGGATSYIQLRDTLQSGATFYVSSGTVQGTLTSIGGFIGNGSGLTNISASDLAAGTYSNAITMSNLSHTGGSVAANIISGMVPGTNLAGGATSYIQLRDTLQSGATFYVSSGTVQGTLTSVGGFVGSGSGLTNLNASNLGSGTVPSGAISGNYNGITGVGTIGSGVWNGSSIGGAYLAGGSTSYIQLRDTLQSGATFYVSSGTVQGTLTSIGGFIGNGSGLTNISASDLVAGTYSNAITMSNLSHTGGSVAANIITGIVPGGNLGGGATSYIQLRDTLQSGATFYVSSGTVQGTLTSIGGFVGNGSGLTNVTVSDLAAGTYSNAITMSNLSHTGGSVAANIITGVVPGSNLGGGATSYIQLRDTLQSGATFYVSSGTVQGTLTSVGGFVGSGTGLTSLNANSLSAGTVPSGAISGNYSGITGVGTIGSGVWNGSSIGGAYLAGGATSYIQVRDTLQAGSTFYVSSGTVQGTLTSIGGFIGNGSGLTNISATDLAAGTYSNAITMSNLSHTGGSVAANIISGMIPGTNLGGGATSYIQLRDTLQAGSTFYVSSGTVQGTLTSVGGFVGSGAGLTNLNASNLGSGTVPSGAISGNYSGITGVGSLTSGNWNASPIGGAYLAGGATSYIQLRDTLQSGATFYVSSGTVQGTLTSIGGFIGNGSGLTNVTVSDLAAGTYSNAITMSNLSHTGGSVLSSLLSGVVSGANLGGGATSYIQLRDTLQSGATFYISSGTVQGTLTSIGGFVGSGAGLSNLNASNLGSGTVPSGAISGNYNGITGVGTIGSGVWNGSSIGGAYLAGGATSYIQLRDTLQSGATFYVSSGTVQGTLTSIGGFIGNGSGLTNISASDLAAGTYSNAITMSNLSHTGGSVAANIITGIVPGGNLGGGATSYIQLRDTLQSGATFYVSSGTVQGTLTSIGGFIGNGSGLTNVSVSDLAAGTYGNAITMSNLSHTGGSVAANIITGVVPGANLGSGSTSYIQLRDTLQSGATFYVSSGTVQGTLTSVGGFVGSGAGLTNLNASSLGSGTVPSGAISGNYSGITGVGTIGSGVWNGSSIGGAYLAGGATSYIQLRDTLQSGATFYVSSGTVQGTLTSIGGFIGNGSGLTNVTVSDLAAGTYSNAITMSNLSHTGGSVAANIITGMVPGSNLGGGATSYIQLRDTLQSGATFYVSSGTVQGTLTSVGGFVGSGAGLTSLNASNLGSGTVPSGVVSGSYSGITGVGTIGSGVWNGSSIGGAYLAGGATSYIQLRDTLQTGATFYVSSGTVQGTLTSIGGFIGNGSGLTNISASDLAAGTYGNAITMSNLSHTGGSVAANIITGVVAGSNLGGGATSYIQLRDTLQSGATFYVSSGTVQGTLTSIGGFIGNGSGLTNVSVSDLAAGTYSNAITMSNLSHTGGSVAANIITGVVAGSNLGGGATSYIQLRDTLQSGATFYVSSGTVQGTLTSVGGFVGSGAGLTSLNANSLSAGTVPSGAISGNYSGITGVGTIGSGVWNGSSIGGAYLAGGATSYIQLRDTLQAGSTFYVSSGTVQGTLTSIGGFIGNGSGLTNVSVSDLAAGTYGNAITMSNLSHTGGSVAANIISGVVSGSNLGGGATSYIQLRDTLQPGSTFYVSSGTVQGTMTSIGGFVGSGAGLTNLNAAGLSGTVPSGAISGNYSGITGVGTLGSGNWNASPIGGAYLAGGATSYIQLRDTLQSGATFYVSSGTVQGTLTSIGGFIGNGAGLTNVSVSDLAAGTYGNAITMSNLSHTGGSVAANILTGMVSGAQLGGGATSYVRIGDTLQSGASFYVNAATVATTMTALQGFVGPGTGITSLNASSLTSGSIPDLRLSSNVPLLPSTQTWSGRNTFSSEVIVSTSISLTSTPVIRIPNSGTLTIRNGNDSNLMSLVDSGGVGTLSVTNFFQVGNLAYGSGGINSFSNSNINLTPNGTGKVGIGTSAPKTLLHVSSGAAGAGLQLMVSTGTTNLFEVNGASVVVNLPLYFADGTAQTTAFTGAAAGVDLTGSTQTKSGGLNAAGSVGAGTSAPAAPLHVFRNAGTAGPQAIISTGTTKLLEVNGASVAVSVPLYFADGSAQTTAFTGSAGGAQLASTQTFSGTNSFDNSVTVSSNLFISNGNVGIGTSGLAAKLNILSPAGSQVPALRFLQNNNPAYGVDMWVDTAVSGALVFTANNNGTLTNVLAIDRTNKSVGIGTLATSALFQVGVNDTPLTNGSAKTAEFANSVVIGDNNAGGLSFRNAAGNGTVFGMGLDSSNDFYLGYANSKLYFRTGSAIQATLNGSNLGIGTATPNSKLHVFSAAGTAGPQMIISTGTTKLFEVNGASVVVSVPLYFADGSAQTTAFTGAAAGAQLTSTQTFSGQNAFINQVSISSTVYVTSVETGLKVSSGAHFALSGGLVGIGTNAPLEMLDVNGSIRIQDGGHIDIGPSYRLEEISDNLFMFGDSGFQVKNRANSGWATVKAGSFEGNSGSATSPAFAQGSDTNTGMGFAANDTVSLITNGTERIRIDSAGLVGVGTATVGAKLHVSTAAGTAGNLLLISTGATNLFEVNGTSVAVNVPLRFPDGSAQTTAFTGAVSGVDLTGSTQTKAGGLNTLGYLGAGTDTPSAQLHVYQGGGSTGPQLIVSTGSTKLFEVTATSVTIHASSQTIISGGRLGIGTNRPDTALHVNGIATLQDEFGNAGTIKLYSAGVGGGFIQTTAGGTNGVIAEWRDCCNTLFAVGPTGGTSVFNTNLFVDARLGIGTASPSSTLHAFAAAGSGGPQMIVSTGTTRLFEVNGASVALGVPLYFPDGSAQTTAYTGAVSGLDTTVSTQTKTGGLNVVGSMGLGTAAPSSKLDIFGGSITIRGANAGLSVSGNTGIGTNRPTSKFDVLDGSVTIRGTNAGLIVNSGGVTIGTPDGSDPVRDLRISKSGLAEIYFSEGGEDRLFVAVSGGSNNIITGSNDNDAAISAGSNLLIASGGGSSATMFLKGDKTVGIGTIEPLAQLHVSSGTGSAGPKMIVSTGTTKLFEVNGASVVVNVPLRFADGTTQTTAFNSANVVQLNSTQTFSATTTFSNMVRVSSGMLIADPGSTAVAGFPLEISANAGSLETLMRISGSLTATAVNQNGFQSNPYVAPAGGSTASYSGVSASPYALGSNLTGAVVSAVAGGVINLGSAAIGSARGASFANWPFLSDLTNSYAVYLANPLPGAGVTNNYGLYIEPMTRGGTLNYALYSAGGPSYFNGSVGLGTTSPKAALHVSSAAWSRPLLIVSTGSTNLFEVNGSSIEVNVPLYFPDGSTQTTAFTGAVSGVDTTVSTQTKTGGLNVSGSVGAGTSSPLAPLHVFRNAGAMGTQLLVSTGATKVFEVTGSSVIISASSQTVLMGGRIGIGTALPAAGLDVYGGETKPVRFTANSGDLSDAFLTVTQTDGSQAGAYGSSLFAVTQADTDSQSVAARIIQNSENVNAHGLNIIMAGAGGAGKALVISNTAGTSGVALDMNDCCFTSGISLGQNTVEFGDYAVAPEFLLSRSAANTLTLRNSNGANIASFRDNVRMGIGTAAPGAILQVSSGAAATTPLLLVSTGTAKLFEVNGASVVVNVPLRFADGSTQTTAAGGSSQWITASNDVYNSNSGNVGVGTSLPSSKFDLSGGSLTIRGANMGLAVGATLFIVAPAGNVGIGTDSPNYKLQVTAPADDVALTFSRTDSTVPNGWIRTFGNNVNYGAMLNMYNGGFSFYTEPSPTNTNDNTTESMSILNNGNVGIGTNGPASLMQVWSANGGTGPRFLVSTGTTKLFEVNGTSVALQVPLFFSDGTMQTTAFAGASNYLDTTASTQTKSGGLNTVGKVGIGTAAPLSKLHVFQSGSAAGPHLLVSTGATTLFEVNATSTVIRGSLMPGLNLTHDLGDTSNRWNEGYFRKFSMLDSFNNGGDIDSSAGDFMVFANAQYLFRDASYNPIMKMVDGAKVSINDDGADPRARLDVSDGAGTDGPQMIVSTGTTKLFEVNGASIVVNLPLKFPDGTTQTSAAAGGSPQWTTASNDIYNSNSGNVGVGTTLPSSKFDLSGGSLTIRGADMGLAVGATMFIVAPDGNVGVGKKASYKFEVFGDPAPGTLVGDFAVDTAGRTVYVGRATFTDGDTTNLVVRNRWGVSTLKVDTGNGTVTSLEANVGIGTAAPSTKFQVFQDAGTAGPQMIVSTGTTKLFEVNGASVVIGVPLSYSGAGLRSKVITLAPEYAGATLSADGSGTTSGSMTSDNTGSAGGWKNYYEWSSTNGSNQDYTVIVRVKLPEDFESWETGTCPGTGCALEIAYQTGLAATTNNGVSVLVNNDTDTPGTAVCTIAEAASTSWTTFGCAESTLNDGASSEWDAAGESAVIRLKLKANSTASALARIGDITLRYKAKF